MKFGLNNLHRVAATAVIAAGALALGLGSAAAQSTDAALNALHEAAKKEGKVVMYGDQSVELIQQLGDAFKKRFPGVDFDFFRGDTTQLMQRFESETNAKRHNMDMLMTTANRAEDLKVKGWLAKYDSVVAKTYKKGEQPEHGYWYNYGLNTTSFAYNTTLVPPNEVPKTWADLLDPKWKGKIGMQDPKSGGGGAHTLIMKMHGFWGEAKWRDYMEKLGGQIGRYGTYFPIREALMSGEIAIHFAAYPDFTEDQVLKGAPINWATPEFTLFLGLTLQLNEFAPRPAAGKLLLEFLLTDEAQKIIASAGKIPAESELRPGGFARLSQTELRDTDYSTIYKDHDKAWFDTEIRKYFAVRN